MFITCEPWKCRLPAASSPPKRRGPGREGGRTSSSPEENKYDHDDDDISCEKKANVRSNLHSGNCDHDKCFQKKANRRPKEKSRTCTVARRKAGWTALSHLAASPRRIHLNSTLGFDWDGSCIDYFGRHPCTTVILKTRLPQHLSNLPSCTSWPLPPAFHGTSHPSKKE